MQNSVRDILLSFCPAAVRRTWRPESTLRTLRAATWTGLAQLLLAGTALIAGLKSYLLLRAQQMAPHLARTNETAQAIGAVVVALEYLIHPLALFLLYLGTEGLIRFAGGLLTNEIVPSLLVFLGFKTTGLFIRSYARGSNIPEPVDCVDYLPDHRVRIASFREKSGWNGSITIGISGQWYEVEREENGTAPRRFVYILRPVAEGKVLRGYQESDAGPALSSVAGLTGTSTNGIP